MRRHHRSFAVAIVTAAAVVATLAPRGAPAAANAGLSRISSTLVAPELTHERLRYYTGNGGSDVQVLRFPLEHQRLRLVPELGHGVIPGREPTRDTVGRIGEDAAGAVNASFSNPACPPTDPPGEPCGLLVRHGTLLSENVLNGELWPGAFALFDPAEDWRAPWAVGRPGYAGTLRFETTSGDIPLHAVNRLPAATTTGEVVAFNREYGASTGMPAGTVSLTFPDVRLQAHTFHEGPVPQVSTSGNTPIPAGGTVVAANGQWAQRLADVAGRSPRVLVEVLTSGLDWSGAQQAVAAGPLILRGGQITPSSEWEREGFSSEHHNFRLHPRTVVGFTADGQALLVTVDGRRTDSVGTTTQQTAEMMRDLGAVDAVMMDGGGSTTMVVDGATTNVPSDGRDRPVSTSLVVHYPAPGAPRLAGGDRFTTAARVAAAGWPQGADTVLVANGGTYPDALAGGPFAAEAGAPLLLVERDRVNPATADAIRQLRPRQIYVLGGPTVVSDPVVDELSDLAPTVERVWGGDRTATAAAIAGRLGAPTGRAFLASAETFPDALSAAVPAARADAPLLLTWRDRLADATAQALRSLGVREVVLAGGTVAVSDRVVEQLWALDITVTRVAGEDRFQTSGRLLDWAVANAGLDVSTVAVAAGGNFPDALSGGPFGARLGAGVLLAPTEDLRRSRHTTDWLAAHDVDAAWVLGGRVALSSLVRRQLQAAIDAR